MNCIERCLQGCVKGSEEEREEIVFKMYITDLSEEDIEIAIKVKMTICFLHVLKTIMPVRRDVKTEG